AVCIDETGMAKVFGVSKAYFILSDSLKKPELCEPGQPLEWNHNGEALKVYEIQASDTGNGSFQVADFDPAKASGGAWYWWWVEKGQLKKKAI
ncbi:hypothetical protein, partial [Chitinophaga sp.]|uniref:hypothetical protein n=1 Tax=Chitinophaga sp. TaxID=1869181 RepID=UPI002F92F31E